MSNAKVTVLMPVFNGEKYLGEAIESILNQDFTDLEFLIMNDGSTDGSEKIILSYTDPRIRLVNNEKNIGLIATLNKGIFLATGEYIARMDCDDVSLTNRLSRQISFMEKNPGIAASGSYYNILLGNRKAVADFPLDKKEIECFMVFNCPIAHPSAIFRSSLVKKERMNYRPEFIHSEDYDFWSQISEKHELANLPDVLLNYRVHDSQITGNMHLASKRNESVSAIRTRHLKKAGVVPSVDELLLHNLISDGRTADTIKQLNASEAWLKKLVVANSKAGVLDKSHFEKIVLERWLRICFNFFGGKKGIQHFIGSGIYKMIKLPIRQKIELLRNLYNSWKRKSIKN